MDFTAINGLQLTSKDGKTLVPAIIKLFEGFVKRIEVVMDEMRKDFVGKIDVMREDFTKIITESDTKVTALQREVASLKKTVTKLEEKVEENDAYERRDTLIISGKKVPIVQNGENSAEMAIKCLKDNLNLVVSPGEVSVAHRLGAKPRDQRPDQRSFIVKFCRRETKRNVILAARRTKPTDVFINESLTPQRHEIYQCLRRAKREFPEKINGCSTIDGSIYVWLKSPGAPDLRLSMNTFERFESFCEEKFQKPASYFFRK